SGMAWYAHRSIAVRATQRSVRWNDGAGGAWNVSPREGELNRRIGSRRLGHCQKRRLKPVIRVSRIQHAVEDAETGADRGLVIRERILSQANPRVKVPERRIGGSGLLDRDPLAEGCIHQVELLVPDRFDNTRRR